MKKVFSYHYRYLCMFGHEKGYLWNIKDNTMYRVTVPNRQKFLKAVVKAITKHNVVAIKDICIPTDLIQSTKQKADKEREGEER